MDKNIGNFLTIYNIDVNESNFGFLYKDIGAIPYTLAKEKIFKTTLVYFKTEQNINKNDFVKYSNLKCIDGENIFSKYINLIMYLIKNIKKYDVLNLYPKKGGSYLFLSIIAKILNPKLIIFVKLDMGREFYNNILNEEKLLIGRLKHYIFSKLSKSIDFYTVETKKYLCELNNIRKFNSKVEYLPNGFFIENDRIFVKKEKVIMTVGRLGTYQKNNELMVECFESLNDNILKDWKLLLVGPFTKEFFKFINEKLANNSNLQGRILLYGRVDNKEELYNLYKKSSIFMLTSRYEGFPLSLVEALKYGCYLITTNSFDAADEIIIDENIGRVIYDDSRYNIVRTLEDVCEKYDNLDNSAMCNCKVNYNVMSWEHIVRYFLLKYINRCKED